MAKLRIEIQIAILAVIIAAAVVTSGYFAYKSLSQIVDSIHREARPDNKLFLIKNISSDLSFIENNVRLYVLTSSEKNLKSYDTLQVRVAEKLETLYQITPPGSADRALVDSFNVLSLKKLKLWQNVLNLHNESNNNKPGFTELYSKLEEPKFDTIKVEKEKKGLLRKIFGGKKTVIDTTIVVRNLQEEEIRNEIQNLESEIKEKGQKSKLVESNLIAENIVVTEKINQLISEAEQKENNSLIEKTNEADRLAALTYKRLAAFAVTAVVLLLVVLFLLHNYLKKTRAYQRALNNAKKEAESLALAKEKFAANVSHEMRTPVSAIFGLAEQMLHRKNDDDLDEQISVLAQSATHLNHIINDTLDFSKLQADKLKFESVHFSPVKVFEQVHALQKNTAAKKGISLKSNWTEIPEALVGDPLRLKQILINLVGNAVKFTETGEVRFTATTKQKQEKSLELHLEVSDTGIGISKENLKIIFEEFVQAESKDGKKYSGTGLGLAIVKKLVELQGGEITVESEPESGTKVKLFIPYKVGEKEKIKENRFETPEIPDYFSELNILVADDEEFNRFLFKGIFKKWDVKMMEAVNGNDAVNRALKEDFDIILMDVRMPNVNGIEATKAILKSKPEAKIVAITATSDPLEKEACKNAGMVGFLPKPFSEKQLFDAINSALGNDSPAKRKSEKPVVNVAELERLMNGDTVFMKEMMELFIRSTESGMKNIKAALNVNNREMIAEMAHKIAPQSKHLHAMNLYSKIKELEETAAKKPPVSKEKIELLANKVEEQITEINLFLKNYLKKSKTIKGVSFPEQFKN